MHAAGAAMAFQLRGQDRCAVSINGDGGTSEGAFYEAMNIAGARKLPIVFMVVNNKWAISVPIEMQTASETLAQKSVAAGIPGIQVDGNDVIAVRHWVERALASCSLTWAMRRVRRWISALASRRRSRAIGWETRY